VNGSRWAGILQQEPLFSCGSMSTWQARPHPHPAFLPSCCCRQCRLDLLPSVAFGHTLPAGRDNHPAGGRGCQARMLGLPHHLWTAQHGRHERNAVGMARAAQDGGGTPPHTHHPGAPGPRVGTTAHVRAHCGVPAAWRRLWLRDTASHMVWYILRDGAQRCVPGWAAMVAATTRGINLTSRRMRIMFARLATRGGFNQLTPLAGAAIWGGSIPVPCGDISNTLY